MNKNFKETSTEDCVNCMSYNDIVEKILPQIYGTKVEYLTFEELSVIYNMLNNGWNIIPGFYGKKTDEGTKLVPSFNWFGIILKNDIESEEIIFEFTCYINYDSKNVTLYDNERQIAVFPTISDLDKYIYLYKMNYNLSVYKCVKFCDAELTERMNAFKENSYNINNFSYNSEQGKNSKITCNKDSRVYTINKAKKQFEYIHKAIF